MFADPAELRALKLSESDVAAVLERAAQIEGSRNVVSVSELAEAAREAGISDASVVQAVREMIDEQQLAPAPTSVVEDAEPVRHGSRWPWLGTAAFGAMGCTAAALGPGDAGLAQIGVYGLIVVTALRAFYHRANESQSDFQLELITGWAGFLAGYGLIEPRAPGSLVVAVGGIWFVSSAIGGLIVRSRRIGEELRALFGRGGDAAGDDVAT